MNGDVLYEILFLVDRKKYFHEVKWALRTYDETKPASLRELNKKWFGGNNGWEK